MCSYCTYVQYVESHLVIIIPIHRMGHVTMLSSERRKGMKHLQSDVVEPVRTKIIKHQRTFAWHWRQDIYVYALL